MNTEDRSSQVFSETALLRFTAEVFRATGLTAEDAALGAKSLVYAEMRGTASHGMLRLPDYSGALLSGKLDAHARPEVSKVAEAAATVDGRNAVGFVTAQMAMDAALELAQSAGIGMASVSGGNHFGAGAFYLRTALEEGCIAIITSNSAPCMPAWGGTTPILGTNPVTIGVPGGAQPSFILDMATSIAARGQIRLAAAKGQPIPEGWAIDGDGAPTMVAEEALKGALLPFGGAKGAGLALFVDLLSGILSGAAYGAGVTNMYGSDPEPANVGHCFIVIRIPSFMPREIFQARYDAYISTIRADRPVQGGDRVRIPGERAQERIARCRSDGIFLAPELVTRLEALAEKLSVQGLAHG